MAVINLFKNSRKIEFTQQIRPHLQILYRQAYRLSGSQESAEDLVQDLLIQIYEKNIDLKSYQKPAGWLLRALYNLFVDQYRKKNRLPIDDREYRSDEIIDAISDESESPHTLLEQHNTLKSIEKALKTLNPEQQLLISLHDVEGYSLPELAEIMSIPIGTLKSRLHRARHSLREIIDPELIRTEPFAKNLRVTK